MKSIITLFFLLAIITICGTNNSVLAQEIIPVTHENMIPDTDRGLKDTMWQGTVSDGRMVRFDFANDGMVDIHFFNMDSKTRTYRGMWHQSDEVVYIFLPKNNDVQNGVLFSFGFIDQSRMKGVTKFSKNNSVTWELIKVHLIDPQ